MNDTELADNILEILRSIGPMSIQEILYLLTNDNIWILKLNPSDIQSKENLEKNITNQIKKLAREEKIREYICETGYRRRYGIPEMNVSKDIPLQLDLKIALKKCSECLSWVINYTEKCKHMALYSCNIRKNIDDSHLNVIEYDNKMYVIYKSFFLGVFDRNKLRLPYKNNRNHIPELFIASKLAKNQNINSREYLKLSFQEVIG